MNTFKKATLSAAVSAMLSIPLFAAAADLPQPGVSGTALTSLIAAARAAHSAEEARIPVNNSLDSLFDQAQLAATNRELDDAIYLLETVERLATNEFDRWAAISSQVALYRQYERFEEADALTERLAAERPDLRNLMVLWTADTAVFAGRLDEALAGYAAVAKSDNPNLVGHAMKQTARVQAQEGDFIAAAETYRRLLDNPGAGVDPRWTLGQALLHEALAKSGAVEVQRDQDREAWLVADRELYVVSPHEETPLQETDDLGIANTRFLLDSDDRARLDHALELQSRKLAATAKATCTPATAWSGFQLPFTPNTSNYGYRYMASPDSTGGYHPGVDLNWGWGSDDKDLDFAVVADGCVTDSPGANKTPTTWGAATVQHSFVRTWTSQYGHADKIYYSTGAAVKKGYKLGNVGDIDSPGAYHLHFEIREQDHPKATDADAYYNGSKTTVGDYYQNPEPFVVAHPPTSYYSWFDESAWSFSGAWSTKNGVGNENDMRTAATTPTSTRTNYAAKIFTVPSSATYKLFVFVPYNYATTTKAPYRVVDAVTGTVVLNKILNQAVLEDAWASLGTMTLTSGRTYRLEIASNTGESGKLVGLDDVLILR